MEGTLLDIQQIAEKYGFKIENLGGICTGCGRYYKVHFVGNEHTIEQIGEGRFSCRDCRQKKADEKKRQEQTASELIQS